MIKIILEKEREQLEMVNEETKKRLKKHQKDICVLLEKKML